MVDLGGCRLPWKSLMAISFTSTGAAERGFVVAQPPSASRNAAANLILIAEPPQYAAGSWHGLARIANGFMVVG
jgi:hypothetical protein